MTAIFCKIIIALCQYYNVSIKFIMQAIVHKVFNFDPSAMRVVFLGAAKHLAVIDKRTALLPCAHSWPWKNTETICCIFAEFVASALQETK